MGTFPDGKGDRTVRKSGMDCVNDVCQDGIGKISILASLQNEGAKAQLISVLAAVQNGLLRQAVSAGILVAPPDSAIEAVIFAVVCKFDQATDEDTVLIMYLSDMSRTFAEVCGIFGCKMSKEPDPVFAGKCLFMFQTVDELFHRWILSSFFAVFSGVFA